VSRAAGTFIIIVIIFFFLLMFILGIQHAKMAIAAAAVATAA
jgi:hypothetical protein